MYQSPSQMTFSIRPVIGLQQPGVNFINVLRTNFSYKRRFGNVRVTRKKLPKPTFVRKIRAFNVDEIDCRGPGQRVVSYSFYGDLRQNPEVGRKYFNEIGARAEEVKTFYPGMNIDYYDQFSLDHLLI
jgi:hypothetical protein